MKILILCNKPPYPPIDGGAIGIFNLSRNLASLNHEVHILAMNTSKHKVNHSALPAIANYHITYIDVNTEIKFIKALKNIFFSKFPYNAERFISKEYLNELNTILSQNSFDIIQMEGPYLWFCIESIRKLSNAKISMKSHNIENEIWFRSAFIERNLFKKLYLLHLAKRVKKFEKSIYNKFDYIFAVTPRDKNIFLNMGVLKPILVVPTGIDPPENEIIFNFDYNSIFFIGALDWMPNQEGILWFVDKVWLNLLLKYPSLEFHIAGRNAPEWLPKRFQKTNIIYHGEVKDSYSFINQYAIMVAPLFSGSGMRVKIVEGMSLGKPIVTTTIGAEGLDVKDGEDIVITDTVKSFISKIGELIDNKEFTKKLSINAHKNAVDKYNNIDIAKKVARFYAMNLENENYANIS